MFVNRLRQVGLAHHQLRAWARRASAAQDVSSGFVEVPRLSRDALAVLTLAGGARLEFSAHADPLWAGRIILTVLASC